MALPRFSNTHRALCKVIQRNQNPINPNALFPFSFRATQSHSPFSTTNFPNGCNNYLSSEQAQVAYDLISIFTKQPFSSDNPELKNFAPILTTKLVEYVLNGLKSWKTALLFFTWSLNQSGYKHNCYTFNAMASSLSRARQNAPLRALALDVVKMNCLMTPGGLGFFLRCLGSVGLVKEANTLFDQVRAKGLCVPNAYTYACLLEVISKSSSFDLLEMRLKEMMDFGWELDKYTLTPLLAAYCNVGEFDKALDVFYKMYEKKLVDAHVCSILIVSFSKWGKVDMAFELIGTMEDLNIRLNEKTFYVLINGFVKESRVDRALQLFSKMRKLGFGVNVSLYDVLIGGLCKNKEPEKALRLYSEMKQLGIRPDVGILTKIISFCSDEGHMISFFEETVGDMSEEDVTLLYNSALKCLVNVGAIDKAHFLLRAMVGSAFNAAFGVNDRLNFNVRPSTSCFRIVIDGLLKTDKLDMALCLFKDMIHIGCKPDLLTYNNLIDGLCISNRLEESYELLRDMEESGLEPTQFTLNSLYGCLCRREDVAGAFHLVKRMHMHGHKPWIKYSSLLVKQLCKHGRVVEACKFLHDMLQEGFLPDIVAYSAALDGLVKTQDVDSALHMFKEICARGCCPDVVTYNILINGLCKAQRTSEAEDVVNEMLKKGLVPSIITYNSLIDGWCKIGDIGRAMDCLSKMTGRGIEPSVVTYTSLIDGLCATGRSDDALTLLDDMRRRGCAPNRITFTALINGLCKCGRPDTGLVYLRKMEEMEMKPDNIVYLALVSAFLSVSNQPMAFEILQEMVDAGSIPNLPDDRSSSGVRALIAEGSFPTINFSDSRDED